MHPAGRVDGTYVRCQGPDRLYQAASAMGEEEAQLIVIEDHPLCTLNHGFN